MELIIIKFFGSAALVRGLLIMFLVLVASSFWQAPHYERWEGHSLIKAQNPVFLHNTNYRKCSRFNVYGTNAKRLVIP